MAPRPLWSGIVSFGLVSVPVKVYSAISEHKLQFHLIHERDGSPIGYQKLCKLEGVPVPDDEVVKAFELRNGEFVKMTDEDFELARASSTDRTIEITDFVSGDEIDPLFVATPYYVGPGTGGDHVYALLAKAMEESGLAAVVTFVMRDRRHLGALRVHDGVLVLEQLHFADELRPLQGIAPANQRVSKQELELAGKLIESYTSKWKPEKYEDTYRDELCALIKAKRAGKAPELPEPSEEAEPIDLMEALRQSVRATAAPARHGPKTSKRRSRRPGRTRKPTAR